jgi:hypothetical protein
MLLLILMQKRCKKFFQEHGMKFLHLENPVGTLYLASGKNLRRFPFFFLFFHSKSKSENFFS